MSNKNKENYSTNNTPAEEQTWSNFRLVNPLHITCFLPSQGFGVTAGAIVAFNTFFKTGGNTFRSINRAVPSYCLVTLGAWWICINSKERKLKKNKEFQLKQEIAKRTEELQEKAATLEALRQKRKAKKEAREAAEKSGEVIDEVDTKIRDTIRKRVARLKEEGNSIKQDYAKVKEERQILKEGKIEYGSNPPSFEKPPSSRDP